MARLPRTFIPGYPSHVAIRGNNRQDIFRTEGDRIFLHRCLVETTRRHGVDVHSYVFMSNHVHLLVTSALPGALGKAIQSLGRRYVSYFNYLHRRTGTLWEGRYKSCPVTTDRYVLACMRYIDSNPIRAGIVDTPGQVRWSSFRCLALGAPDDLVTPHIVYSGLAMTDDRRRAAYQALFQERQSDDEVALIRERLQTGWMLGEGQPSVELETAAGRRLDRAKRGRPRNVAREPGTNSN